MKELNVSEWTISLPHLWSCDGTAPIAKCFSIFSTKKEHQIGSIIHESETLQNRMGRDHQHCWERIIYVRFHKFNELKMKPYITDIYCTKLYLIHQGNCKVITRMHSPLLLRQQISQHHHTVGRQLLPHQRSSHALKVDSMDVFENINKFIF